MACAIVALFSTVGPATTAQAHSELISSTPAAGARLPTAPPQIRLVFSERVEPQFITMTLAVADEPASPLDPRVDGSSVTVSVPPSATRATSAPASGGSVVWTVNYRVASADAHPVSGSLSFTVANAGRPSASAVPSSPVPSSSAPTPAPAVAAPPQNLSASAAATPPGDDQQKMPLMLLLGAGVIAAVGAAVWLTRTKPAPPPGG